MMNISIMSTFKITSRALCSYVSEYEATALKLTDKFINDWNINKTSKKPF